MRFQKATALLALIAVFGVLGPAQASEHSRRVGVHRAHVGPAGPRAARVSYANDRARGLHPRRGASHFAELVGDPESGAGFYPLPWVYRVGAWRERQRHAYNSYNAVRFAIMSTAISSYAWPYGYGAHRGVFNPYDGYGTPFFAGYYGPAGDSGAERGPFGRPYN